MGSWRYYLTLDGVNRAEDLVVSGTDSQQCFVAMWFSDEMDVFRKSIAKAIREAGYDPFIISMKEYNEDVSDEIIAEIRRSKFLVAEFTGNRGGVYFEAGFAYSIEIPVIWCCRNDWFDTQIDRELTAIVDGIEKTAVIKESRQIHFDINHYNFIVWENPEELYQRLKVRIEATVR